MFEIELFDRLTVYKQNVYLNLTKLYEIKWNQLFVCKKKTKKKQTNKKKQAHAYLNHVIFRLCLEIRYSRYMYKKVRWGQKVNNK